ncbi:transcription antitermination factor NusB [Geomobilimonas luticola]|uniref:Transcription antitermination protein NusB n=1 Tax=Geomobilimonas luticola TaxID=1114878 RepID=A0ABS5SFU1_9BACT|nr:transcription antitermination factor NusB [Geomobilimonas luticola]
MGSRREGRELALQALYSFDLNPMELRQSLVLFWEHNRAAPTVRDFAEQLVIGVAEHRDEIDRIIEEKSKNWSLGRMARIDLNILRIAVYELHYRSDIPKNVTINEAIEVAKKFGTEESAAFINGIIDEVASNVPDK